VARLLGDDGDAAHEGAADAEDVNVHSQRVNGGHFQYRGILRLVKQSLPVFDFAHHSGLKT
jgi:hypothetical protein